MARDRVQALAHIAAPAGAVWSLAREFCEPWHPVISHMEKALDPQGALIRAFRVHGEKTLYREQLTWFSDSDRRLSYRMIEGIEGAEFYEAALSVAPAEDGGAVVTWCAEIVAPAARMAQIVAGTQQIFDMGIKALAEIAAKDATATAPLTAPKNTERTASEISFDALPRLALSRIEHPSSDKICLFLHGIGGNRSNWAGQLGVAARYMGAAALDLRGYGGSTLGPHQSRIDDYCEDILRVREQLGAKKLVLVGLSYGSWIATSFAMRHPELLAGLVLSGGCTGMSEAYPEEREAFRISREVPLNAGQTPRDFAPQVVKILAGPDADHEITEKLKQSMELILTETYRDALNCFTSPSERFDFAKLTMPVLLMTGSHDRLAPPAEIRAVSNRILAAAPMADVRFEVIDRAGHLCNIEKPESYNHILDQFLARLP